MFQGQPHSLDSLHLLSENDAPDAFARSVVCNVQAPGTRRCAPRNPFGLVNRLGTALLQRRLQRRYDQVLTILSLGNVENENGLEAWEARDDSVEVLLQDASVGEDRRDRKVAHPYSIIIALWREGIRFLTFNGEIQVLQVRPILDQIYQVRK